MIEVTIESGGDPRLWMKMEPPAVYLDHWALREISESDDHRDRFLDGLHSSGGTLCVSCVNQLEFIRTESEVSQQQGERLLQDALPQIFFIQPDPWVVIEQEAATGSGGDLRPPQGDAELLQEWISVEHHDEGPELQLNAVFTGIQEPELATDLRELQDTFVARVSALKRSVSEDSALAAAAKRTRPGPGSGAATRALTPELLRFFVLGAADELVHPNHALDFLHAVVPVAYCDLVVLDGHWEAQAHEACLRLSEARHRAPFADVFSKRREGLNRFLDELDRRGRETAAQDQ